MPTLDKVADGLHKIIDAELFVGKWRSDEDLARIVGAQINAKCTYEDVNDAVGKSFKGIVLESPDPSIKIRRPC